MKKVISTANKLDSLRIKKEFTASPIQTHDEYIHSFNIMDSDRTIIINAMCDSVESAEDLRNRLCEFFKEV